MLFWEDRLTKTSTAFAILSLILSFTTTVHAALIAVDDPTYGIGSITRDTDTNLEWLDLTFTDG